jgi:hypothetical protein
LTNRQIALHDETAVQSHQFPYPLKYQQIVAYRDFCQRHIRSYQVSIQERRVKDYIPVIRYENIRLGRVYILKAIQLHSVSRDFLYSVEISLDNARLELMNILQTKQMLLELLYILPWEQDWQQRDELRFIEQRSYHIMNLVVSVRSD